MLAVATSCVACSPSYSSLPPLSFEQVDYSGPDGEAWSAQRVPLPKLARNYELAAVPSVQVVEVNPTAENVLLFVHGLGSNLKFWRFQLNEFAARGYRIIAMDMVGFGKSDKPADFPYTIPAMAHVLEEAMQIMGAHNPVLIGHSMGAQTSLALVIEQPQLARALVLLSPAGFEKFTRKEKLWFKRVFSTALVMGSNENGIRASIRYNNFNRWHADLEWLVEERVRVARANEFSAYAYANVKSVHGLLETDYIRSNLDRIHVPTLIVFGHMDRLIPNRFLHPGTTESIMRFGYENIDGATLVGFPECGHSIQLDCPDEVNAALHTFLASLPSLVDDQTTRTNDDPGT